jgi:hypothetical protein
MRISSSDPQARALPSVEASGVKATREASDRAAASAEQTVRAFREKPNTSASTVSFSNESQDLASATVEMIGARAELKAGVKLLQAGDEMTEETLKLLDRRT